MHKALLILGLLQGGPKTGYDLNRIVRAHGELYTDLKKAEPKPSARTSGWGGLPATPRQGRVRGLRRVQPGSTC